MLAALGSSAPYESMPKLKSTPLQTVLRPLVQLLLDKGIERIAGLGLRRRSGAVVGIVYEQIHRLHGPLFGGQRAQRVLHRQVVGCRKVERNRKVVERIADPDRNVEIHRSRLLAVGRDVGTHLLHGRNVERRIGRIAHPLTYPSGRIAKIFGAMIGGL